jgi:WD40 repeat protein
MREFQKVKCLGVLRRGKTHVAKGVILLHNGTLLTWVESGDLFVWDVEAQTMIGTRETGCHSLRSVYELSDGMLVCWSDSFDNDAFLGSDTGKNIAVIKLVSLKDECQDAFMICHACCQMSGIMQLGADRILGWSFDGVLTLWDYGDPSARRGNLIEGRVVANILAGLYGVSALAGDYILLHYPNTPLTVRSTRTWEIIATLNGIDSWIRHIMELADGSIVTCLDDKTLRVWNMLTGDCHHILKGHQDIVHGAHQLPDKRVLSWAYGNTFWLWDTITWKRDKIIRAPRSCGTSWKALTLASGNVLLWPDMSSGSAWIFNPTVDAFTHILEGRGSAIRSVVSLKNGNIVTLSDKHTLRIWETGEHQKSECPEGTSWKEETNMPEHITLISSCQHGLVSPADPMPPPYRLLPVIQPARSFIKPEEAAISDTLSDCLDSSNQLAAF